MLSIKRILSAFVLITSFISFSAHNSHALVSKQAEYDALSELDYLSGLIQQQAMIEKEPPEIPPGDIETVKDALKEYLKKLKEKLGHPPTFEEIFKELDVNGDGKISQQEWEKFWREAGHSWFLGTKAEKILKVFCSFLPASEQAACLANGISKDQLKISITEFLKMIDRLLADPNTSEDFKRTLRELKKMLEELLKTVTATSVVSSIELGDPLIDSLSGD
ncbi:MAG: hypothetical protein J0M12_16760 [Deltaproteobacteria bacterium]|nr:hypothetical protein [Deltaproteobacteria bacterium]